MRDLTPTGLSPRATAELGRGICGSSRALNGVCT